VAAKGTAEKELEVRAEEAEAEKDSYCDNHPQRKARTFTGGGAYEIHLCDECTPPHFTDAEI
jgi:hypothetical protein